MVKVKSRLLTERVTKVIVVRKSVASNGVRIRVPPRLPILVRKVSVIGSTDELIPHVP